MDGSDKASLGMTITVAIAAILIVACLCTAYMFHRYKRTELLMHCLDIRETAQECTMFDPAVLPLLNNE